jgi:superfamily II DNA or RNA helicase
MLAQREMERRGHTLFIVERKTLCSQGAARFRKYGMLPAILRGEDTHSRGFEAVTVASIQSLRSRKRHPSVAALLAQVSPGRCWA